ILTGQDDAEYVLLAKALHSGVYTELWRADAPGHAQYPPGYPAILAAWGAVAGDRYNRLVLLSVLSSVVTLVLIFSLVQRRFGTNIALGSVIILAVNPQMLSYSGSIASEGAYTALTLACLYCIDREASIRLHGHETPSGVAWLVAACVTGIFAAL